MQDGVGESFRSSDIHRQVLEKTLAHDPITGPDDGGVVAAAGVST